MAGPLSSSFRVYCCRYYHDGKWWALDITAQNREDAAARVKKLGNLILDGELMAEFPARVGFFAKLLCAIRNFILPNVKDEPRRELARLVRQHEA